MWTGEERAALISKGAVALHAARPVSSVEQVRATELLPTAVNVILQPKWSDDFAMVVRDNTRFVRGCVTACPCLVEPKPSS